MRQNKYVWIHSKRVEKTAPMTYDIQQDSETCIWWTLYHPMDHEREFVKNISYMMLNAKNELQYECTNMGLRWTDMIKGTICQKHLKRIGCQEIQSAKIINTSHPHSFDSLRSRVVKLSSLTNGQASRPQNQYFGYLFKARTTDKREHSNTNILHRRKDFQIL